MDESQRVADANRRARERGLDANLQLDDWLKIISAWDFTCAWCGGHFEQLDHVIPLNAGGTTTSKNCVPSCARCNQRKGTSIDYSIPPKQLKLWD